MGAADDLQRLGLRVGRVVSADEHPGARGPSLLLTIDLGEETREATVALPADKDQLVGTQVVCVTAEEELLILAAQSHGRGAVLLRPDGDVEDGSIVA